MIPIIPDDDFCDEDQIKKVDMQYEGISNGLNMDELEEAEMHLLELEESNQYEDESNPHSRWKDDFFGVGC